MPYGGANTQQSSSGLAAVILFFAFPPDVRKVLYTTNALNKPDTAGDGRWASWPFDSSACEARRLT